VRASSPGLHQRVALHQAQVDHVRPGAAVVDRDAQAARRGALDEVGTAPAFAVESIRRWWHELGQPRCPDAKRLLITADCGGSNGVRVRLWTTGLQRLADQTGLSVIVAHLPPGASAWNRIERRLFAFITQNWRGKPLLTQQAIVPLIASTATQTGLVVQCRLDQNAYEKGIKVPDEQIVRLDITPAKFHGEWNYAIAPRTSDG